MNNQLKRPSLDEVIDNEMNSIEFAEHFKREEMISRISNIIVNLRNSASLTQQELAHKARTTQPVIARLESGSDNRVPSLELLARITSATGNVLNITWQSAN